MDGAAVGADVKTPMSHTKAVGPSPDGRSPGCLAGLGADGGDLILTANEEQTIRCDER